MILRSIFSGWLIKPINLWSSHFLVGIGSLGVGMNIDRSPVSYMLLNGSVSAVIRDASNSFKSTLCSSSGPDDFPSSSRLMGILTFSFVFLWQYGMFILGGVLSVSSNNSICYSQSV